MGEIGKPYEGEYLQTSEPFYHRFQSQIDMKVYEAVRNYYKPQHIEQDAGMLLGVLSVA